MTEDRLEQSERILAAYAAKYGLSNEARDYFAKWGNAKDLPPDGSKQTDPAP
jgi:hypothetical protein